MKKIKKIFKILSYFYYYILGNIFVILTYKRKYIKGKHFESRYFGVGAIGWKWVCQCAPFQLFLRINGDVPWPVTHSARVDNYKNISFHLDNIDNFQSFGSYFQATNAELVIGKGTYIAPNVGLICQNHNIFDPEKHVEPRGIIIGEKCWLGMNSVILPGVVLGDHTTVGAGAIVTKSFTDGFCVIAGVPAKIIKNIEKLHSCGDLK